MMKGVMGQQNSCKTSIGVHSTMRLKVLQQLLLLTNIYTYKQNLVASDNAAELDTSL